MKTKRVPFGELKVGDKFYTGYGSAYQVQLEKIVPCRVPDRRMKWLANARKIGDVGGLTLVQDHHLVTVEEK